MLTAEEIELLRAIQLDEGASVDMALAERLCAMGLLKPISIFGGYSLTKEGRYTLHELAKRAAEDHRAKALNHQENHPANDDGAERTQPRQSWLFRVWAYAKTGAGGLTIVTALLGVLATLVAWLFCCASFIILV